MIRTLISIMTAAAAAVSGTAGLTGKILYHSYSSYEARDSILNVYSADTGKIRCINDEVTGVYDLMNASFGCTPDDIVFMGLTGSGDSADWGIYRYNLKTRRLTDLTASDGLREEDIRLSPDSTKAVYKQGKWNHSADCMEYNIILMDLVNGQSINITNDISEDSMPCFSADDLKIYYARGTGADSGIYMYDLISHKSSCIYNEDGIDAYYPVSTGCFLYFTRWIDSFNRNDGIYRISPSDISPQSALFNSHEFNCSDPCCINNSDLIISSTSAGSYDLYLADFSSSVLTPLTLLNTPMQELGASYFDCEKYYSRTDGLKKWLLGMTDDCPEDADVDMDADVDLRDYCLLKE